ncbi:CPBP family intramembrane glutamic endopeptidase [Winogradskyella sp. PG-2]|uniref:CPBP family intramembrane glutamic endopeptidase n=1 Tax=Winogradskyella sp. PG-2 TaxID=754409 RepID=UPI0004586A48|nr:CPBP family intramembrane glutamic endopeptidase [Winogradskyella sp. PG-2]BAO76562.1 CAAX amino terminal protease family [Winogradskyella sp. PG-2]
MNFGIYNQVVVEWVIFIAFILIPIIIYRNKVNWKWIGLAVGIFLLHKIVLFLGVDGTYPDLIPGRYNWEGKIAAIIFLIFCSYILFPKKHGEWGLRLSQNGIAKKAGIVATIFTALIAVGLAWFYFSGIKKGDVSDWLYQLSMPGIEEEIYYRGIMLLILDRAFLQKWKFAKVNWSWGAIIMIGMFYFTHVIHVDSNWNTVIIWGDFLPGFYGLLLMYIRLATGSLVFPIILHGWINVVGYLI